MILAFIGKDKRAVTLAEILISALILVIAASGLFASFIAANKFVNRSKRRMAAVNLARLISEKLYTDVKADTWTDSVSNPLACATYDCSKTYTLTLPAPALGITALDTNNPLNGFNPSATLDISLDGLDPTTSARVVSVTINWNE